MFVAFFSLLLNTEGAQLVHLTVLMSSFAEASVAARVETISLPATRVCLCWALPLRLLFDHPIRPRQHLLRNRQTDLLRRLEINYHFKLGWLLHRKVGWFDAFQDFVHVCGNAPKDIKIVG